MFQVLTSATTNGDSSVLRSPGGIVKVILSQSGTGTVTLHTSGDKGSTYVSTGSDGQLTASGQFAAQTALGKYIKLVITGASGLTANAWIGFAERPHEGYALETT